MPQLNQSYNLNYVSKFHYTCLISILVLTSCNSPEYGHGRDRTISFATKAEDIEPALISIIDEIAGGVRPANLIELSEAIRDRMSAEQKSSLLFSRGLTIREGSTTQPVNYDGFGKLLFAEFVSDLADDNLSRQLFCVSDGEGGLQYFMDAVANEVRSEFIELEQRRDIAEDYNVLDRLSSSWQIYARCVYN